MKNGSASDRALNINCAAKLELPLYRSVYVQFVTFVRESLFYETRTPHVYAHRKHRGQITLITRSRLIEFSPGLLVGTRRSIVLAATVRDRAHDVLERLFIRQLKGINHFEECRNMIKVRVFDFEVDAPASLARPSSAITLGDIRAKTEPVLESAC